MDRKIESKWESLMAAMVLVRSDEKFKRFVSYGERIVDLVEQGDYETARATRKEFIEAVCPHIVDGITDYFRKYNDKMEDLVDSLPKV